VDDLQALLTRYRDQAAHHDALNALLECLRREGMHILELHERRLAPADRDEIVQNAITAMWQCMAQFRGDTAHELRTYFRRTLHRKVVDFWRSTDTRRRRLQPLEGDGTGSATRRSPDGLVGPSPEDTVEDEEDAARLQELLQRTLSRLEFQAITLRAQGHKDREIAKILGVTIGTVATALFRARDKLRKAFQD